MLQKAQDISPVNLIKNGKKKGSRKVLSLLLLSILGCIQWVGAPLYITEESTSVSALTAVPSTEIHNTIQDAFRIHADSWERVVNNAATHQYDRYGLYVSRTIVVRHPEIYLQADRLFITAATTNKGFRKAYHIKDVHDSYFFGPEKGGAPLTGPPFSITDINFFKYTVINFHEYYPQEYPGFSFLDRRILPIASTLKPAENQITQLELGIQHYFSTDDPHSYLIYCDNENTYLFTEGSLLWMNSQELTDTIQGNPILIFNEHHVWYPLMGRDDTAQDQTLQDLVQAYTTEITMPSLEAREESLLKGLKKVTALLSDYEKDMALLYSLRPCWGFDTYVRSDSYRSLKWHNPDLNDSTLEITSRLFMKHANYLSPVTSYLAAVMKSYTGKDMLEQLETEYVKHAATPPSSFAHGHTWFCDLVEQTVDECYTTRAGHCIVQACNIAAVLDIVGIEYYWLEGFSNKITFIHDWLYLPQYDIIMSNGIITPYREETILYHDRGYPLNRINFICTNDSWAFFLNLKLNGTISPQELIDILTELEGIHNDPLFILKQSGGCTSFAHFIKRLKTQQAAAILLQSGHTKKEGGDVYGALYDFFEAYSSLKNNGFTYSDRVHEDTELTMLDVEKDLVYLCLQIITASDAAFCEERYENALYGFAFVHPYWQSLSKSLPLVMISSEYEPYAGIGSVYTPLKIEETVQVCIHEITQEAQVLSAEGHEQKSNEKIVFIITTLSETNWKYEKDMEELKEKKDDIMHLEEKEWNKWPLLFITIALICIAGIIYTRCLRKK